MRGTFLRNRAGDAAAALAAAEAAAADARTERRDAEARLAMERRRVRILEGEAAALRRYLVLILRTAGGELTLPRRDLVEMPRLPALAVREDLDGNVTISTQ